MSKRVNPNGKSSRCNRNASRGLWKGTKIPVEGKSKKKVKERVIKKVVPAKKTTPAKKK